MTEKEELVIKIIGLQDTAKMLKQKALTIFTQMNVPAKDTIVLMNALTEEAINNILKNGLIDNLEKETLEAIYNFYTSLEGKKFLAAQPAIIQQQEQDFTMFLLSKVVE